MSSLCNSVHFYIFTFRRLWPDAKPRTDHFHLTLYICTSFGSYKGSPVPANGMYVTSKGVVLFDTPWDSTQFQPLLDSIKMRHDKDVVLCISTHFHEDRTAGLEFYRRIGIKTYTTERTDKLSRERNEKRAEFLIYKDTVFLMVNMYSKLLRRTGTFT